MLPGGGVRIHRGAEHQEEDGHHGDSNLANPAFTTPRKSRGQIPDEAQNE